MKRLVFVCFYADLIPRHRLMLRALAGAGWSISIVSWNRNWPGDRAEPEPWVHAWRHIRLRAGAGSARLLFTLPALLSRVVEAVRAEGRVEAILLTHYCLLPAARRLASYCAQLLYDAPEYFCEDMLRYFGPFAALARPLVRALERRWLARVNAVTTIDSNGGWLEKYYRGTGKPVLAVWNTPALADDAAPEAVAAAAAELGGGRWVAYAGQLKRIKGLEVALRAVPEVRARHPEARFLFIGALREEPEYVEGLLAELGIGDAVLFRPPVPYRALQGWLRACAIGLAPLEKERNHLAGAGNCRKVFSYMQAGLPVIVSDVGAVGRFVQDGGFGRSVEAGDPAALARAVCAYLDDAALARRHGEAARRAFEDRYHWEREEPLFTRFLAAGLNR